MKHYSFIAASALLMLATCLSSCGKKTVQQQSRNPFGQVYEAPCAIYDDDKYFASTGFASGDASQKGALQLLALKNAQDKCAMKIKHATKGLIQTFNETIGRNNGIDIDAMTQIGIDNSIDAIVNNTTESCLRFSEVNARGDIECYIAIQIPKKDVEEVIQKNLPDKDRQVIEQNKAEYDKIKEDAIGKFRSEK